MYFSMKSLHIQYKNANIIYEISMESQAYLWHIVECPKPILYIGLSRRDSFGTSHLARNILINTY